MKKRHVPASGQHTRKEEQEQEEKKKEEEFRSKEERQERRNKMSQDIGSINAKVIKRWLITCWKDL